MQFCEDNDIFPMEHVIPAVEAHFELEAKKRTTDYGNARAVRNYFEETLLNQANRLVSNDMMNHQEYDRYYTSIAKSASDHREGDNIAHQIIKGML